MMKKFHLFLTLLLLTVSTGVRSEVVSGKTYSFASSSTKPDGWITSGSYSSNYFKLVKSSHIQTNEFKQGSITEITIKARTFGGVNASNNLITISWFESISGSETVLGTIEPTENSLIDYSISGSKLTSPTPNTTGYIKIQCKNATAKIGSGVSAVTISYTEPATVAYKVTFNVGSNGSSTTTELTETAPGAGVTLPAVTANAGYKFVGWATSSSSTAADAGVAGDTYYPTETTTLYAVYKPLSVVTLSVNGETKTLEGSYSIDDNVTLPATVDNVPTGVAFMGWSENIIETTNTKPVYYAPGAQYTVTTAAKTLYAVYATGLDLGEQESKLAQTLEYDTWTYSGTTTDKNSYRLFGKDSYIESAPFDLSTLSKVIVYGGTFGGSAFNSITIGDGNKLWLTGEVSGNKETGENVFTGGTPLTGNGSLRIISNSGDGSNGVRISKVEIYLNYPVTSYRSYRTSLVMNLELDEKKTTNTLYAGSANVTIGRSFNANAWNTLVLPFALTAEQVTNTFGANIKVAKYQGATAEGTLQFEVSNSGIQANVPVFVWGASDVIETINGVTVEVAAPTQVADGFDFVGAFNTEKLPENVWFIAKDNNFYKALADQVTLKPMRAYFAPKGKAAEANSLKFAINEDGVVTYIHAVSDSQLINADVPAYNLTGQKVSKNYKGVVIQNGKKFIKK